MEQLTKKIEPIDLNISNLWYAWRKFRKGKRRSAELENFNYYLENNLFNLTKALNDGLYRHGGYKIFYVTDNKKRRIAVASIRDRIVHRLLYEYLVPIYDSTFVSDAWSCRRGKGLLGAIKQTQQLLHQYPQSFVWRADVVKFFDNVDRGVLFGLLQKQIVDNRALRILREVTESSLSREQEASSKGIPIGNLTSQIFANIYLNEFDQFIKKTLRPQGYVRYGDDFIAIAPTREAIDQIERDATFFLHRRLDLVLHEKNNVIVRARHGLHFLGMRIYPAGRTLNKRNLARIKNRLTIKNIVSYSGLIKKHMKLKHIKEFQWEAMEKLENFDHAY